MQKTLTRAHHTIYNFRANQMDREKITVSSTPHNANVQFNENLRLFNYVVRKSTHDSQALFFKPHVISFYIFLFFVFFFLAIHAKPHILEKKEFFPFCFLLLSLTKPKKSMCETAKKPNTDKIKL